MKKYGNEKSWKNLKQQVLDYSLVYKHSAMRKSILNTGKKFVVKPYQITFNDGLGDANDNPVN